MSVYTIKLVSKQEIAENTMAFMFEKPDGFNFKAGQFGEFTLINPQETDAEGNTRAFSLTQPPSAKDLMVTTRMRDTAFKRVLKNLPLGSELQLDAPHGSFTLHNKKETPAVFLTGGIGITPVRSIVIQAARDKLPHELFLFYSNHRPEDTAFLDELKSLERENSHYHFIPTMTDISKSKEAWQNETGYINKKMLSKFIKDLAKPIYYISGPAAMVSAMHHMLNEAGIDDDTIRMEEFSGY
ncbi:Methane monooxygenase component C [Legionella massiliensis]|uniref:Methane monooxygenase component C n=1 Tax=Legionella massiliensis TaxID=1034943 RepID=A0A078L5X7_9GAMM|nr:FAD-dependent oxidoreductase [Legionella massiliensis]CDZ79459.1 Methane monooxygenase component C [Legionella massiliensis]CEE15197.1 Methane monooxygenase component C [Legionella massiliensis]